MKNYLKNISFEDAVKNNNIEDIKEELIENVIILLGNKNDILEGLQYAEINTDFRFDEHKEMSLDNIDTLAKEFSLEKSYLRLNFSKERYMKLIDLFPKVFEYEIKSNNTKLSIVEEPNVKNNPIAFKVIAVVIVISILTYTVAKCSADDSTEATKTSIINDSIQAR